MLTRLPPGELGPLRYFPKVRQLALIREDARRCERCELGHCRTKVVFGVGEAVHPLLTFVGEAPGANEDVQGEPFVGVAGKRLNKWIEWMGLDRRACYILNTVMCRPPQNRNPLPMEIEACGAWFREQMTIVSAPVIVTLGKVAAHAILKSNRPMNKLRGHWHQSGYGKVRCTFHPAYIARRPDQEVGVFADLREVRAELDKHVASLGDAGEDQ